MKQIVCAVFDQAVGQYLTPFFMRSKMEALRSFKTACNEEGHSFQTHPEDYTLFALGEFDPDDASFTAYLAPEKLGGAIELREAVLKEVVA